jgi:nucleoside-diphosphate-sugar epimerase
MRVLVTGASGFIGRHLVGRLQDRGCTVYAVSRRASIGANPIVLPELTAPIIDEALQGLTLDAVVNLAAVGVYPGERDIATLTQVNSVLPCEILAVAAKRGANIYVQAGSSAEYAAGSDELVLAESSALGWSKAYGATKAIATKLLPLWGTQHGTRVSILRFFNVYGPGEARHRLLPSLVTKLSNGEAVALSAGTQLRDFLYVLDVCDGVLALLQSMAKDVGLCGEYNLCSGEPVSVAVFSRLVADAVGVSGDLLQFGTLPMRPDDLPRVVGDGHALRKVSGWRPRFSLAEGIEDAVGKLLLGRGAIE